MTTGSSSGAFRDRCVVVTGAAGGIGSALARRFAHDGARLVLLDLEDERLAPLAAELETAGTDTLPLACDVTSLEACQAAIARACQRFGGIDVLVANAGITHVGLFRDTEVAVIRRVMEVNFFGAVNCTKAALPSLIRRRGQIVVLSSVAGIAPLATRCGYAASKHALHGFFGSLRAELRDAGVAVSLICPSFVRTGIGDRALGGDGGPATMARTETGTPVEPERLADAIHRAARKRRRRLLPFRDARLAALLFQLLPGVYERTMVRRLLPKGPPEGA
jgi:NAD(P)-dependent dehydrogenase (short-subunit alcohol dehydrogenase family)